MKLSGLCISAVILLGGCTSVLEHLDKAGEESVRAYVSEFNAADEELYVRTFSNESAAEFLNENIPVFDCPDQELEKTYYFRWWTYRKHVRETPEGYVVTEFLPDVKWAGKYNVINCPAEHHFREGRWLRDSQYLSDYAMYWTRERDRAGRYSCPISHAILEFHKVCPDMELIKATYPALKQIYAKWEENHWDEQAGLFWQKDWRDGMEISVSGTLCEDGTGYRTTINSYMYADAMALAQMAEMLGEQSEVEIYKAKAEMIRAAVNDKLWDEQARFYKVIPRHRDMSFSHVRELHGYIPWVYGMPADDRYDAWAHLSDTAGFKAPFGPTTAEQRCPEFKVSYEGHVCQWNGPSWPFATSQTLNAIAGILHADGENQYLTKDLYLETLRTYSSSHRRVNEKGDTICWIDENIDPYTGEWISRKMLMERDSPYYERGKDYNHSTFCDLIITGLVGIQPHADGSIVIQPLIPENEWEWFSLHNLRCAGRDVSVVYDRTGKHYGCRPGLNIYVNGKRVVHKDSYNVRVVL